MSDTSSWPAQSDGETYVSKQDYGGAPVETTRTRKSRGGFHVASAFFSLLLTAVALVALDYSLSQGVVNVSEAVGGSRLSNDAIIAMGVAAAVLLVVAALSRLSGLGPLLAGLVWGVLPAVGFALVPAEMNQRIADLPDPYADFLTGLGGSPAVFPVVGGLLVGLGLFGRWRGAVVERTVVAAPVEPDPAPQGV